MNTTKPSIRERALRAHSSKRQYERSKNQVATPITPITPPPVTPPRPHKRRTTHTERQVRDKLLEVDASLKNLYHHLGHLKRRSSRRDEDEGNSMAEMLQGNLKGVIRKLQDAQWLQKATCKEEGSEEWKMCLDKAGRVGKKREGGEGRE